MSFLPHTNDPPGTCDRTFTIKLGLSQSLMVQERDHNPNVTLKGYTKKLWGLFGQKAHKTQQITLRTQQITLFHPKKRFSLNPNIPRTELKLKNLTHSGYPTKLYGWSHLQHMQHSKFPDWFNSQNQVLHWSRQCCQYLGPSMISPNKILITCAPYTYRHVMHLTFCGRTLKHTLFEIVYEEEKAPQNNSMPIF